MFQGTKKMGFLIPSHILFRHPNALRSCALISGRPVQHRPGVSPLGDCPLPAHAAMAQAPRALALDSPSTRLRPRLTLQPNGLSPEH